MLINEVNRVKGLCIGLNTDIRLDDSVLYEVIKAIYKNECLTDAQLIEYIRLKTQLNNIHDIMLPFSEIYCCLDSPTEYFIFGLSFKEQESMKKDCTFKLENTFSNTFYCNYKTLSLDLIVKKQKEIINKYKHVKEFEKKR